MNEREERKILIEEIERLIKTASLSDVRFISGGMMHVYNNWMADDIKAEPEVLARALCNMLMGGFNGVIKE